MPLHVKNQKNLRFLQHAEGPQKIIFAMSDSKTISVQLQVNVEPTPQAWDRWRAEVWNTLYNAAQNQFYVTQQEIAGRIAAVEQAMAGADTLTLRQEEREEVMKGVLRWILGPAFDFMPYDVRELFDVNGSSPKAKDGRSGSAFTGSELYLTPSGWSTMFAYQEMVVFLQQAIEWENLLFICYPYFWDVPDAWDFVRGLTHPDPTRQQFLRSGSARVVLTVRPGYERAFAAFLDTGNQNAALRNDHPYLTIGNELRAYAQANYPGIPPANPAHDVRPLLTPLQRRAWQDLQTLIGLIEDYHADQDAYPTTAQGLAELGTWADAQVPPRGPVPLTDPWGNSYVYASPGRRTEYELSSLGANGEPGGDADDADITSWSPASLVAEWFEYTPTHGTDIEVNTTAEKMA
jgi:type II secretion system protein G